MNKMELFAGFLFVAWFLAIDGSLASAEDDAGQ